MVMYCARMPAKDEAAGKEKRESKDELNFVSQVGNYGQN